MVRQTVGRYWLDYDDQEEWFEDLPIWIMKALKEKGL
jgi:hypothetical protein